jgi:hypothetical protein
MTSTTAGTDGADAILRPAVHLLAKPEVDKLNTELAFPCVWISPWSRSDGLQPLRHSLVLNAITSGEDLLDDLVNEPTHDGYLADFLMRNKGFIRN